LGFYAHIFYTLNSNTQCYVKDVTVLHVLMEHLTPKALAYWYMDYGAFYYGWLFCTESFSMEGLLRLKTVFLDKYSIEVSLTKRIVKGDITGYRLYINPKNCEKFVPLIKP